jgi:hypothetical protein
LGLSNFIYTLRQCLIYTCHAAPVPFWKRLLTATAQRSMGAEWERHGMCELASAVLRRHVGDLPAIGEWQGRGRVAAWERHDICELTSAVLRRHVGDLPAIGEWQGRGRVPAGERHGICELSFNAAGERHGMWESGFVRLQATFHAQPDDGHL